MPAELDRRAKKRIWVLLGVALTLVAASVSAIVTGGDEMTYESPAYRVVERSGAIEIREYESYIVAETIVDGSLESAGNRGFRILARYIFGDNRAQRKIAMTTPVRQEVAPGTSISMTTPVTQERAGSQYRIQFMMPAEYSRAELPEPNDLRIAIREVPARRFATVRYSGTWSRRNYEKHLARLLRMLDAEGLAPVGEPIWARYNPPFTPWFLRRNEILTAFERPGA